MFARNAEPTPNPEPQPTRPARTTGARPLDSRDRAVVRERLLELIAGESDAGRLARLKLGLAAEFSISSSQLDGTHADLTKRMLTIHAENVAAARLDLATLARAYGALRAENVEQSRVRLEHLASETGVESSVIRNAALRLAVGWDSFKELSQRAQELEEPKHTPRLAGAHKNYDFAAKVLWRSKWEEEVIRFVRSLPAAERERLRVLCFPGKHPEAELSIYFRAGLRPENVVAVEGGDDESKRTFLAELTRLGGPYARVDARPVMLDRYLKTNPAPFSIISLDYHGCYSIQNKSDIQQIPYAQRSLLLVNLLAAREKEVSQQRLIESAHMMSDADYRFDRATRLIRGNDSGRRTELCSSGSGPKDLSEAREAAAELDLVRLLGLASTTVDRPFRGMVEDTRQRLSTILAPRHPEMGLHGMDHPNLYNNIKDYACEVIWAAEIGLSVAYGPTELTLMDMPILMTEAVFRDPHIVHAKRYSYDSPVDPSQPAGRTSPFISCFVELEVPDALYGDAGMVSSWLWGASERLITSEVRNEFRDCAAYVTDGNFNLRPPGSKPHPRDKIVYQDAIPADPYEDEVIYAPVHDLSIRVSALRDAARMLEDNLQSRTRLDRPENWATVPRTHLG